MSLPFSLTFSRCCKNVYHLPLKAGRGIDFLPDTQLCAEVLPVHRRRLATPPRYRRTVRQGAPTPSIGSHLYSSHAPQSLDLLLTKHISENIATRLRTSSTLSQIAQIVTNLEYFDVACGEIEQSLASLRTAQRGGTIHLTCRGSFTSTTEKALERISNIIASKLQDSFELSEYDWTPSTRMDTPSGFLFEIVFWLTMNVDGLVMKDVYKDKAYDMAIKRVADCLMVSVATGFGLDIVTDRVDLVGTAHWARRRQD